MDELISKEKVLRCLKRSSEEIDWGQSEDGDAFKHYIGATYRTIAEFKPEQSQWISVDDRLPDKCNNYLVYFGKGIGIRMKTACWLPEKRIWKGAEAYSTLNGITHWMPLPEPPKEVIQE